MLRYRMLIALLFPVLALAVIGACADDVVGPTAEAPALDWGDDNVDCYYYEEDPYTLYCQGATCYWNDNWGRWQCDNGCDILQTNNGLRYECYDGDDPPPPGCEEPDPSLMANSSSIDSEDDCDPPPPAEPPPTVNIDCAGNTVERGAHTKCWASPTDGNPAVFMYTWSFSPFNDSLFEVEYSNPSKYAFWEGEFVAEGTVFANGEVNGRQASVNTAFVTITPRDWPFDSTLSVHVPGLFTPLPADVTGGATDGLNCPINGCGDLLGGVARVFLPRVEDGQGLERKQVPTGPNKGYWYVTSARFSVQSASGIAAGFSQSYPASPTYSYQVDWCRQSTGDPTLGPNFNWWEYNQKCGGLDPAQIVRRIYEHEAGHHSKANRLAETWNPNAEIEDIVTTNEADLKRRAQDRVTAVNALVRSEAMNHDFSTGGPVSYYVRSPYGGTWTLLTFSPR